MSNQRSSRHSTAPDTAAPDPALRQLLAQYCDNAPGTRVLWVAGEEACDAQPPAGVMALTGRVDVAHALRQWGIDCTLSDFDFSPWPAASLDAVYYRISKEKALVHHVINQALLRLRPGGSLYLAGYKQDGFKTYLDKAASAASAEKSLRKGDGGVLLGQVRRGMDGVVPAALPDQDYTRLREIELAADLVLFSKPGLFGWNKVDAGSQMLIEQLRQHQRSLWPRAPQRVLDLGCGYGYLSVMAARLWPSAEFIATDNNLAAVAACAANFEHAAIGGEVIAADCGDTLSGDFQAVLCNPPFHRGFDMLGHLGERFLQRSRQLLSRNGCALFVVNQFLPIERLAAPLFGDIRELARDRSFKVLALRP